MSSHRYWRVLGIKARGLGALQISEFALCDVVTPTTGGTLTANISPDVGLLSALSDGSSTTAIEWSRPSRLVLHWDFGTAAEVNNIQIGSGATVREFPFQLRLQWSDDDVVWNDFDTYVGLVWPGAFTLTDSTPSGKSFRYWRVYITANNGDAVYTALQEVELHTTVGGSDITTSLMATSQSDYYEPDNALASKAFDGNLTNATSGSWVTGAPNFPHWMTIDLGSAQTVDEFRLYPQNGVSGPIRAPKDFRLEGSANGIDWSSVGTFTTESSWTAGSPNDYLTTSATRRILCSVLGAFVNHIFGRVDTLGASTSFTANNLRELTYSLRNFLVDRDTGTITGTVKEKFTPDNTPLHRRVRLYRDRDGMLLQETWSDAVTGDYAFYRVDTVERYTVLAHDYKHNYRAAVADNLVPT